MDEYSYWLSYGDGSKSEREAWVDKTAIRDHDGRAKTRTYISQGGVDAHGNPIDEEYVDRDGGRVAYHKHLNDLQNGKHANDLSTRKRRARLKRDVKTWMSQLECTDYQVERVIHLIEQLDDLKNGYCIEASALALISLVANEDGYWVQRGGEHEQFGPERNVDTSSGEMEVSVFTKVMGDCGVEPHEVRDLREKFRERFNIGGRE